jgi:hypothetical protein
MRLRYLSAIALVSACGGHFKREVVGGGAAAVSVRGAAAPMQAASIALTRGTYEMKLRFDVPRAQVVEWTVACPGTDRRGAVGETFEAYRERRIAELRRQRERQRQTVGAVTGAVIGAVAPTMHAHGQASGPNGTATVDATVSGQAVGTAAGSAIADATVSDTIELPIGDVGAARLQASLHVVTPQDGACTVTAVADDPNVMAMFDVVRIRDLDAEARERAVVAKRSAIEVRGQLSAQLVAVGADPLARERRLEAEARLRAQARAKAEADARARAELQAKLEAEARARADAEARVRAEARLKLEADVRLRLEVEARLRASALSTRAELYAYLTGTCNADPNHRQRIREEREARLRIEADARARARADMELRLRVEREQREIRLRAEREQREARLRAERERKLAIEMERARRIEVALSVRADLRAFLVALGARERPPMPAPLPEDPGAPPFTDAEWVAGVWRWTGGQWMWEAGGWRDTTMFGDAGSSGGPISIGGGSISIGGGSDAATHVEPVRDHRSQPASTVRDHRSEPATPEPKAPVVRDHRKDNDKNDESGPKVRDHRRR